MEPQRTTFSCKPKVTLKRRKQAKRACINCRRTKTGCNDERPCRRCISLGLENSCIDAPRRGKKQISYSFGNITQENNSLVDQLLGTTANENFVIKNEPVSTSQDDTEKQFLYKQIAKLKQEQLEKEMRITQLERSLQSQVVFSGLPLARWKLVIPDVCQLLSFSNGFVELCKRPSNSLRKLTCLSLYTKEYQNRMRYMFSIFRSGRIQAATIKAPITLGTGEVIDVLVMFEFGGGGCTTCMEQFNPENSMYAGAPYFEPVTLKLRDYTPNSPPSGVPMFSTPSGPANYLGQPTSPSSSPPNCPVPSPPGIPTNYHPPITPHNYSTSTPPQNSPPPGIPTFSTPSAPTNYFEQPTSPSSGHPNYHAQISPPPSIYSYPTSVTPSTPPQNYSAPIISPPVNYDCYSPNIPATNLFETNNRIFEGLQNFPIKKGEYPPPLLNKTTESCAIDEFIAGSFYDSLFSC